VTPDEFRHKMKKIKRKAKKEPEVAHAEALDLMNHTLRMNGFMEGMEVFEKLQKFYALRKKNG